MAGTSGGEVRWGIVSEVTPGTTPATPAFVKSAFDDININPVPNIQQRRANSTGRRLSGITRSGVTVTGTASGGVIYGVYDDLFASLLQGAWTSDVLKDTVTGQTSFTLENASPAGAGGTLTFLRYPGVEFTGATIQLTAETDSSIEFNLQGTGAPDANTTAITGATYADPSSTDVLGSGSDVGTITMGALTLPCIRSLAINLNVEDKNRQPRIASDELCGIQRGALIPELSPEFYIEDGFAEIYNAARSGTEFAMTVPIGKVSGEKYTFEFPRCQLVEGNPAIDGADYFLNTRVMALYDETEDCALKITRAVT